MSKRPQPDSNSAEIAGWSKHAAHFGDNGGDGAGSDEVPIASSDLALQAVHCLVMLLRGSPYLHSTCFKLRRLASLRERRTSRCS